MLAILFAHAAAAAVAPVLRRTGLDAVSTPEAGRLAATDEDQLMWATAEGRVVVTFNIGDFVALHTRWMQQGRHHAGIIVSTQMDIGDVIRRLLALAASLDAGAMQNRLEFLRNW